jgi:uncharacterized protein YndB with AHSA1/START domain
MKTKYPFELTLSRVIDAPRERVFEAWSKPEQLSRWFAPEPYTLPKCEMDFRPGGRFSMAMRGPEGQEHPFTGVYREIVAPEKIVWVGEFPYGPKEQMRTTVTFEALGRKTKVTAHQAFTVLTPETEPHTKGAQQGWTATLDQLAAVCSG